jgi:hypothetical protein
MDDGMIQLKTEWAVMMEQRAQIEEHALSKNEQRKEQI